MAKRYNKSKDKKEITQRIKYLFNEAYEIRHKDHKLANRYVFLARKLSLKAKVKIPTPLKRRFCKHCLTYFIPGKNYTVRSTTKTITYTCKNCKKWMRFGYKKKAKSTA